MEERMQKLRSLYGEVSGLLQEWMQEDLSKEARPAAYSIDQAMMFMRTSFMWTSDAAAQTKHYETKVAPKLEMVGDK